ncbi:MAG: hypothetical protein LCH51_07915 [Bacteroidetes bacterium]|nr:hypothetical protein [Bacteroidota bacterium]
MRSLKARTDAIPTMRWLMANWHFPVLLMGFLALFNNFVALFNNFPSHLHEQNDAATG